MRRQQTLSIKSAPPLSHPISFVSADPSFCKMSPLRSVRPSGNRVSHGDAPSSRRKRRFASATAAEHDA
jgi:hypothetical protein